jgi:benzodiazapine receptor
MALRRRLRHLPDERPHLALVVAALAVEFVGVSGAVFTASSLASRYGTLQRPALAPPGWVFGPVWTALFALLGVALWLVWRQLSSPRTERRARIALVVFAVHFAVNVGWSAAFFGLRSVDLGLAVTVALLALILLTVRAFDRVDRRAAFLLVLPLLDGVRRVSQLSVPGVELVGRSPSPFFCPRTPTLDPCLVAAA